MKYSIIEDIYYNRRGGGQNIEYSNEYFNKTHELSEELEKLSETLNDKQKEILNKISDMQMGVEAETALINYKEGLKIGLLLFAECFQD